MIQGCQRYEKRFLIKKEKLIDREVKTYGDRI